MRLARPGGRATSALGLGAGGDNKSQSVKGKWDEKTRRSDAIGPNYIKKVKIKKSHSNQRPQNGFVLVSRNRQPNCPPHSFVPPRCTKSIRASVQGSDEASLTDGWAC